MPDVKTRQPIGERQGFTESRSSGLVRFELRKRWPRILSVAVGSVVAACLTGCTTHTQTQYFAVKDPNTGAANYYRLSINGCGSLTKYNLQAGYYSAAAVDILRGRMPDVPELDLPIERAKTFDSLLRHIDKALLQEAKQIAPITDPGVAADGLRARVENEQDKQASLQQRMAALEERLALTVTNQTASTNTTPPVSPSANSGLTGELAVLRRHLQSSEQSETTFSNALFHLVAQYPYSALGLDLPDTSTNGLAARLDDPDGFRTRYIKLSRLAWLSSLSNEDVAAVGMNETLDPFQFRKLVFWTKSTTLDIDQAAGDIDAIRGQVVEIGRNYKNISQEREAARVQAQADQVTRANATLEALKSMTKDGANPSILTNLIKMLVPQLDSPAQK
jgi:hypothetical protein